MSNWNTLLIRLGDRNPIEYGAQNEIPAQIETCYGVLLQRLEYSENDILELLIQCAEELPHKGPYYATLVGLLNLEHEEFGRKVVDQIRDKLQDALETENCDKIRLLLRFLTVLMCSSVINPGSLIEVFETLISSAATTIDEERGNPFWQARADFYIFCLLACLPWGGLELFERVQDGLERVMAGIEAYLRIRKPIMEASYSPFVKDMGKNDTHGYLDFLEDLWARIKSLRDEEWKVNSVPRPHFDFEFRLVTGTSHDVRPVTCPQPPEMPSELLEVASSRQIHQAGLRYPQRIQRLYLFPAVELEKGMQPIDRFVVEQYVLDVLLYLNGCRKECAAYLVSLPVPFSYDHLMAEIIFSQMFLLPKPTFKLIYYSLVIIDLCKALPEAFPAVVARVVRELFNRVADLDVECRTRLVLWFSHHLANFQFIWPWEEWMHILELPKWSPQRVFALEVLEKEVRLSYWDKIKQSLEKASGLEELLPPKDCGPSFKYSIVSEGKQAEAELALSTELLAMVKEKKAIREIYNWVEEKIVSVYGIKTAIEVVMQTLLNFGSKSLTHLSNVLERFAHLFSKLGSDHSNQVLIINEVAKLWQKNAQMTVITVDRMMGYRIISNFAIVRWVFTPSNIKQFHTSGQAWEILWNALQKTFNRVLDLKKKVASAEEEVQKAVEASKKAQSELRSAEASAEEAETDQMQNQLELKLKRLRANVEKRSTQENSAQEQLDVSDALLAKELQETEGLLIVLYKSFAEALMQHDLDSMNGTPMNVPEDVNGDYMAVDTEDPAPMDADDSAERRNQRFSKVRVPETEEQEWCHVTMGQLQAITRHYATEIWHSIKKLDAEVFTEQLHPPIRKVVYSSLRRNASFSEII